MSDQCQCRGNGKGFLQGLVAGAVIGAGIYYYLTQTEEGKKIKVHLKEKGEKALDDLGEMVSELEEKGNEFKQKAKEVQEELEEKAKDVKEEVATEAKEKLEQIEELREKGQSLAKKFFTKNGKSLA